MEYVTREMLENDKVLKALKHAFLQEQSGQNFAALLTCIMDSVVYVPGKLVLSDQDLQAIVSGQVGETLRNSDAVRFVPTLFSGAEEGSRLYSCFSAEDEIPEDFKNSNSLVLMTGRECIRRAGASKGATGIVLDPLTESCTIPIEYALQIDKLQSRLSPEQQEEDLKHPVKNMVLVFPKEEAPAASGEKAN